MHSCHTAQRHSQDGAGRQVTKKNDAQGQNPLISVVIPTYSRANLLPRAIASVRRQTYQNIEIIVVDDNPPESDCRERTRELVESYDAPPFLRLVQTQGKLGGGRARNAGVRESRGEYLAFLDDDDIYLEEKLEAQITHMMRYDLEVCYHDVKWFQADGRLVEHRRLDHVKDPSPEEYLRQHLRTPIAPTATYMLRKSAFERTLGFGDVKMGQDWILMLRCIEARLAIGYLPGCYVHQFIHEGTRLSAGRNKIDGENALFALKKQYYTMLAPRDRRYIEFRHRAVLAFVNARGGTYLRAAAWAVAAALTSPVDCVQSARQYLRRD